MHVSGHACSEELRTLLSLVRPRAVMPIHGEYRMLAAHARLAQDAGVPDAAILIAENGSVVELTRDGARIVDHVEAGVTFVDGLGVGDVEDVALRDRRRLSEDGVLIVVTTVALDGDGGEIAPPELIARGFGEDEELIDELRDEADRIVRELAGERRHGDQAAAGAHPRRDRTGRLPAHAAAPDDPPGRDRGVGVASSGDARLGRRPRGERQHADRRAPRRRAAARLRGGGDRLLPPARALGPGRRRSGDPGCPPRGLPARRGPGRDGARRPRGTALRLPARARARPGRGTLVVRAGRVRGSSSSGGRCSIGPE